MTEQFPKKQFHKSIILDDEKIQTTLPKSSKPASKGDRRDWQRGEKTPLTRLAEIRNLSGSDFAGSQPMLEFGIQELGNHQVQNLPEAKIDHLEQEDASENLIFSTNLRLLKEQKKRKPQRSELVDYADIISAIIGKLYSLCVGQITGRGESNKGVREKIHDGKIIKVILIPKGKILETSFDTQNAVSQIKQITETINTSVFDNPNSSPLEAAQKIVAQLILQNPGVTPLAFKIKIPSGRTRYANDQPGLNHEIYVLVTDTPRTPRKSPFDSYPKHWSEQGEE